MNNNYLIAEFMGMCGEGVGWFDYEDFLGDKKVYLDLKFHESWDWLMPVVEKIEEQHGCDFTASRRRATRTYDANFMDEVNNYVVYVEDCKDRKEATYKAVVRFIRENTDTERMMKIRIADMDSDLN